MPVVSVLVREKGEVVIDQTIQGTLHRSPCITIRSDANTPFAEELAIMMLTKDWEGLKKTEIVLIASEAPSGKKALSINFSVTKLDAEQTMLASEKAKLANQAAQSINGRPKTKSANSKPKNGTTVMKTFTKNGKVAMSVGELRRQSWQTRPSNRSKARSD